MDQSVVIVMILVGVLVAWAIFSILNREDANARVRPNPPSYSQTTRSGPSSTTPSNAAREQMPRFGGGPPLREPSTRAQSDVLIIPPEFQRTTVSRTPATGANLPGRPGQKTVRPAGTPPRGKRKTETAGSTQTAGKSKSTTHRLVTDVPSTPTPAGVEAKPPPALPTERAVKQQTSSFIAGLLISPTQLRQAFILSEILQPPLALRDRSRD